MRGRRTAKSRTIRVSHRRADLWRRDQRRVRRERSPDGRRQRDRGRSGADRVAHTRVVKPPDAASWWSLRLLKVLRSYENVIYLRICALYKMESMYATALWKLY